MTLLAAAMGASVAMARVRVVREGRWELILEGKAGHHAYTLPVLPSDQDGAGTKPMRPLPPWSLHHVSPKITR